MSGPVSHLDLHVPGAVRGQGRPRFNRATGHARTDDKTRAYAQRIETAWYEAMCPKLPERAYYRISADVNVTRPATHRRKDGELNAEGLRRPYPGKPDIDNVVKLAVDALVACGAIPDDAFMVRVIADKRWAPEDGLYLSAQVVG